jgi:hypothetical protein
VKVETDRDGHVFEVQVYLGDLDPEAVRIELYADGGTGTAPVRQEMKRVRQVDGAAGGYVYGAVVPAARTAGDYTPRLIPHCSGVAVPLEAPLGRPLDRADLPENPGTHALALVADGGDFRLCDGRVPGGERRREGRDDPMARSAGDKLGCTPGSSPEPSATGSRPHPLSLGWHSNPFPSTPSPWARSAGPRQPE